MVNVAHLLRGQGVRVPSTYEHGSQAVKACADLLRWLDVKPDTSVSTTPADHGPVIGAAAVLLRAAGIEPDSVLVWPRPTT